jgi:predicted HicB family RNase H-like nuclease
MASRVPIAPARLPVRAGTRRVVPAMSIMADDAVRHYLNLPYRIALTRDGEDEERPWRATVEELAGCEARGATPTDAAARIPAAIADWVASAHAEGREVPEPRGTRAHSGRLLLRMPQSLHEELAAAAEDEDVSLNQYITNALASTVGWNREGGDLEHREPAPRWLPAALVTNIVVVVIAGAVALVLLVVALQQGL